MAILQPPSFTPPTTPQFRSIQPLVPQTNPGDANPFSQGDPSTQIQPTDQGGPATIDHPAPITSDPAQPNPQAGDAGTPVMPPVPAGFNVNDPSVTAAHGDPGVLHTPAIPGPSDLGGLAPDPAAANPDANLTGDVFGPGNDPRLAGAQTATDAAGAALQGTDRNAIQGTQEQKYRDIYGTGAVTAPSVDPNVAFNKINTTVNAGAAIDPSVSARTSGYQSAQDQALANVNDGPNLTDLAKKNLADFQTQGQIDLANKFRDVGRTSAKFGRMGLGDVNSELGSIQGDYNRNLLQKQNELASSTAAGDLQNRLSRLNATSGVVGQSAGMDAQAKAIQEANRGYQTGVDTGNVERGIGQQSLEQSLNEANKGRQIGERNTQLGVATGNQDRNFARTNAALGVATDQTGANIADTSNKLGAAQSLEQQIAGQGASNRNEMRTERGNQQGQAQQSLENRLAVRKQAQAEKDARLRQAIAQTQAGG